ncbi:hypothetical protein BaRGS_00016709 [Batillaria attramentaria]|uniref:Uncharacterized protein n=1 Tax=Batillaria attramentaria TaxID=370345 RepID=A0ABD0KY68_9CAEN
MSGLRAPKAGSNRDAQQKALHRLKKANQEIRQGLVRVGWDGRGGNGGDHGVVVAGRWSRNVMMLDSTSSVQPVPPSYA